MFYLREKVDWIIQQHKDTNHFYDGELPYSFHLKMVVNVFEDFKHLLPENLYIETDDRAPDMDVTQHVIRFSVLGT